MIHLRLQTHFTELRDGLTESQKLAGAARRRKASEYANYLVEIAGALHGQAETSPVAVGMACSQLESRVQAILDPRVRR